MNSDKRSLKELGFFTLMMIAGLLVLYGQVLSGQSALYFRDILHNYYVFLEFMKTSLWNGELPFWNSLIYSGVPLVAGLEPPLFYPFSWMFFLLPFQLALGLNLCLHHLIAGLGVYLLGRAYRWSHLACMVAGLCFSFGGIMISMNSFHPLQNTVAWIPVLLWLAHRICQDSDRRALLGFSLAYGLQIVSGHLEIVYFTSLLLLGYACLFVKAEGGFRRMSWFVLALTLGILLSAIQLLPSLMYVPYSMRKNGLNFADMMAWSHHPVLSYMFLLPENNGGVFNGSNLNIVFGENNIGNTLFFMSVYMGLLTLCGALMALRYLSGRLSGDSGRKFVIFWIIVFGVTLVMSVGHYLPTGQLLVYLPGMSFFRYPTKFLIFSSLAIAMLAGWGCNGLETESVRKRQLILTILGIGSLCLLALGLVWAFRNGFENALFIKIRSLHEQTSVEQANQWASDTVKQLLSQLTQQLLLCLSLAAGLWLCVRMELKNVWLTTLVLLIAGLDLLSSGVNSVWLTSPEIMQVQSPVAKLFQDLKLAQNNQERYQTANKIESIPPNFRPDLIDNIMFRPNIYQRMIMGDNFGVNFGFRNAHGLWPAHTHLNKMYQLLYEAGVTANQVKLRNHLESLSAVRYVVMSDPDKKTLELYKNTQFYRQIAYFYDLNCYIFENLNYLPRTRFYYQSSALKDESLITRAFASPETFGFKLKEQVLLLDDQALKQARALVPAQEAKTKRWTPPQITSESNHQVELAFETNTSGYLVLADQYIPGWKAYDNGREVPILRANFFHRALRVGPGLHQIRFEYQPPGFMAGALITLIAAVIWLIWCFLSLRTGRKKLSDAVNRLEGNIHVS